MATSSVLQNIYKGDATVPLTETIIGLDSASHTVVDAATSQIALFDRNFEPVFYAGTMKLTTPALQILVETAAIVSESALTITDASDVVENVVFADEFNGVYTFRGIQYDTTANTGTATIEWTWDGVNFSLIVNVS
jgi:hypothetical protein